MSRLINYDCTDSILCWWNRGCYKNTIRIKNALTSICNSWSVFQEGGKKFVPSETRLHIVNFSKAKSRRYCINGNSKGNCWGECPSELRVCSKNWKVPGWNPTRHSAWLRDPTSLQSSRWPSGQKCKIQWLISDEWSCPKSWLWGSQIVVKKKNSKDFFFPMYTGVTLPIYVPTTKFNLMALWNIWVEEALLSKGASVIMKQTSHLV